MLPLTSLWRNPVGVTVTSSLHLWSLQPHIQKLSKEPANWFRRSPWESNTKSAKQIGDSSGSHGEGTEATGETRRKGAADLRQHELEGTLDQVAATMHGLPPRNKAQDSQLGPTLTTKVQVEGVSVQALLDTGSPASIISLDLVL